MKRFPTVLAALLTTALVGSLAAVVSTAAPATAAPAQVTVTGIYPLGVLYGQTWTVRGSTTSGGHDVTTGTIELYARLSARAAWSLVATDATPATFSFAARPKRSLQVLVHYRPSDTKIYKDWTSKPVNVLVGRYPTGPFLKSRAKLITGRVKPAYRHRRVVVFERRCNGCRWSRYKAVRTSRHSWWQVHIPVRRMQYRAVVPRSRGFVASHSRILKVTVRRVYRRPLAGVPEVYVAPAAVTGPTGSLGRLVAGARGPSRR